MPIIDVHTHAYTAQYLELLRTKGAVYSLKMRPDGKEEIFRGDTPVALPQPGHLDYDLRISCYSPQALSYLISIVGIDRVLYGTDYPHQVHDMAGMLEKTEAMPPEQRDAIRAGNARRLFEI